MSPAITPVSAATLAEPAPAPCLIVFEPRTEAERAAVDEARAFLLRVSEQSPELLLEPGETFAPVERPSYVLVPRILAAGVEVSACQFCWVVVDPSSPANQLVPLKVLAALALTPSECPPAGGVLFVTFAPSDLVPWDGKKLPRIGKRENYFGGKTKGPKRYVKRVTDPEVFVAEFTAHVHAIKADGRDPIYKVSIPNRNRLWEVRTTAEHFTLVATGVPCISLVRQSLHIICRTFPLAVF